MTLPVSEMFSDTQRMELRSYVELAGEVIAQYWPMRTFIHHNPLHGLEASPFEQAVQSSCLLFGGRGYLGNEEYRRHLESGRIDPRDVRKALEPLALNKQIAFAGRSLSHLDVLAASMIHGVGDETGGKGPAANEVRTIVQRISGWLHTLAAQDSSDSSTPTLSLKDDVPPAVEPLSLWCDRTLGTAVVDTINRELVKWCSAFLDEGEAGWAMPQREQTFYRAWKALAEYDLTLRLIGILDLHDANGLKNMLVVGIKGVAAAGFIVKGVVVWPVALLMMIGSTGGGWAAGLLIQRVDQGTLRWIVVAIGIAMGVYMLLA